MTANDLLEQVKQNLIITFSDDDSLIISFISAAIVADPRPFRKDPAPNTPLNERKKVILCLPKRKISTGKRRKRANR